MALLTVVAILVAKETRDRDLTDVEPSDGEVPAKAPAAGAPLV